MKNEVIQLKAFFSILILAVLIGCSGLAEIPDEQTANIQYLQDKGFRVVSYEGQTQSYELTRQKIVTLPYNMYWGLQTAVDPADYFGKTVSVERFIVTGHPLAKGKVDVYVYVVDERPIGGTSVPYGDRSDGGYWSLDGKTLEELQPLSFQEWQKEWLRKYDG